MTVERYFCSYCCIEVRIICGVEFLYSYILHNTHSLYDVVWLPDLPNENKSGEIY